MNRTRIRWLLLWPVAAIVLALDQLTKTWVVKNIPLNGVWVPFPALANIFWFKHLTNTGAAFGIFRNGSSVLLAIAVVVIIAIIVYARYLSSDRWLVVLSLGFQLGGALGNFTDRVRYGHVVDFIDVPYWPTSNVADSSLIVGVVLLAFLVLTEKEEAPVQGIIEG